MSLKASTHWIQGIGFEVEVRDHHQFTDGKKEFGGRDRGPNLKEYVLAGLCECTGMDVVSLLKKYKVDSARCFQKQFKSNIFCNKMETKSRLGKLILKMYSH